jgi:hypothetical protein
VAECPFLLAAPEVGRRRSVDASAHFDGAPRPQGQPVVTPQSARASRS